MANDEPAHLTKGVEVSAKYRGAFCEAKVTKVEKCVKCKVFLKEDSKHLVVSDDDIKGIVKVGASVEVRKPDTGQYVEAVVSRVNDHSLYTVVFDDGDQETLRRSKLCLKGDRHFMKSETLDDLPLTNPEHFGTPVIRKTSVIKATKNTRTSGSDDNLGSSDSSDDDSDSRSESQSKSVTNEREYSKALQDFIGQVVCIDIEDRTKKSVTIPALVVQSTADDLQLPSPVHLLVKSFKDNKFSTTTLDSVRLYSQSLATAKTAACKDKIVKLAWDKAQQFVESQELPAAWDREQLLGCEDDVEEMSDCEVPPMDERRDRFVAQLYKFMEDRGTPLNKSPMLDIFDLDLFHLFHLVSNMGGYNRVNNVSRWSSVYLRMKLPCSLAVNAAAKSVRESYEKYLHAYEDFNRKLGCTLVSTTGRPERGRHPSSRSLLSFRDRNDRMSDGGSRSAGKVVSKRPGSIKDEAVSDVKGNVQEKQIKEEITSKEAEDTADKSEKSGSKTDDSFRATRKTPKRAQLEAPKLSPISEFKNYSDFHVSSGTYDASVTGKNVAQPQMMKLVRQRRPSAIMRLTRGDAAIKTLSMSRKTEIITTSGVDDHKITTSKLVLMKDDSLMKKKSTDGSETTEDRKNNKRAELVVGDKSLISKRPILRRTSATISESGGPKSLTAVQAQDVSGMSLEMGVASKEDDRDSRLVSARSVSGGGEEGHPIGTRLTVRYGKGNNQKTYEAKVIEVKRLSSGAIEYLVHYAGWNTRYDEWIRRDAIVSVLEEPTEVSPLTNNVPPASMAVKARQPSVLGSIISQAAEKKSPLFRTASKSSSSSQTLKVGKLRKPVDGGDSEDSGKQHQKRAPSLEGNRNQTRQLLSGKKHHRRTRTRSKTNDADDPESDSSSSNANSDSDSEAKDSGVPEAGHPSKSVPLKSIDQSNTDKKPTESSVSFSSACVDSISTICTEKIKSSAIEVPEDDEEVCSPSDQPAEVNTEVKTEVQSIDNPEFLTTVPTAGSVLSAVVTCVSDTATEPLAVREVEELEKKICVELSGENSSPSKVLVSPPAEEVSSPAVEMPQKSPEDEKSASIETEEKQMSRGKKRTAGESLEKSEKKGKSDVKKKSVKEELLVVSKEIVETVECSDEASKDLCSVASESSSKNVDSSVEDIVVEPQTLPQALKAVSDNTETCEETELNLVPEECNVSDVKSQKVKKLKPLAEGSTSAEKKTKGSTAVRGDEKKEIRGKKKSNVSATDGTHLDSVPQDLLSSKVEAIIENDQPINTKNEDIVMPAVLMESTFRDVEVESTTYSSLENVASANALDVASFVAVSQCENGEFDNVYLNSKVDWTGVEVEKEEATHSDDFCNIFEETVKSVHSGQQEDSVENTLSLLQSPCRQAVSAFTDSLPDTSSDEFGASASGGSASPPGPGGDADEEHTSTKSELEANMEVAAYMGAASNDGELSSDDDDDSGEMLNTVSLSPENVPIRHEHLLKSSSAKRKLDENREESFSSGKRRKKDKQPHLHNHRTRSNHNRLMAVAKTIAAYKHQGSDSEEVETLTVKTSLSSSSSISVVCSSHKLHHALQRSSIKYNFLDLDEGRYLEGEERITFLMTKIQDLRQAYLDLKAEVACIDRRRRRHRCKEREVQAAHVLVNSSALSAGGGSLANL